MPQTPNKNYEIQVTGSNTDTWGEVLNDDMISIADRNLGGIVTKTLSNVPVTLTAEESENLIVRLIGALTGDVLVTTACKGMTIIENATSGAFAVTFGNGVGSPVTITQSTRAVIITDGTNGARTAADNQTEFASGTALLFVQAAAPTGWTKQNTGGTGGAAIRVNQTSGGGTGGAQTFDSVFAVRGFSGTVGATTLTVNQIPAHTHNGNTLGDNNNDNIAIPAASAGSVGTSFNTTSAGGGQSHDHTVSINNVTFEVNYLNVIHCVKA